MYEKSRFKTAHCITKSSYKSRSIPGTNQCWAVRVKFLVQGNSWSICGLN